MNQGSGILATRLISLLCATLLLSGCAAIFRGPTQLVPINSLPAGAEVIINGELAGQTPLEVELGRGSEHVITLRWNGQERSFTLHPELDGEGTGLLVADAVPGGILIGLGVATLVSCSPHADVLCDLGWPATGLGAVLVALPVGIDAATGGIYQLSPHEVFVSFE